MQPSSSSLPDQPLQPVAQGESSSDDLDKGAIFDNKCVYEQEVETTNLPPPPEVPSFSQLPTRTPEKIEPTLALDLDPHTMRPKERKEREQSASGLSTATSIASHDWHDNTIAETVTTYKEDSSSSDESSDDYSQAESESSNPEVNLLALTTSMESLSELCIELNQSVEKLEKEKTDIQQKAEEKLNEIRVCSDFICGINLEHQRVALQKNEAKVRRQLLSSREELVSCKKKLDELGQSDKAMSLALKKLEENNAKFIKRVEELESSESKSEYRIEKQKKELAKMVELNESLSEEHSQLAIEREENTFLIDTASKNIQELSEVISQVKFQLNEAKEKLEFEGAEKEKLKESLARRAERHKTLRYSLSKAKRKIKHLASKLKYFKNVETEMYSDLVSLVESSRRKHTREFYLRVSAERKIKELKEELEQVKKATRKTSTSSFIAGLHMEDSASTSAVSSAHPWGKMLTANTGIDYYGETTVATPEPGSNLDPFLSQPTSMEVDTEENTLKDAATTPAIKKTSSTGKGKGRDKGKSRKREPSPEVVLPSRKRLQLEKQAASIMDEQASSSQRTRPSIARKKHKPRSRISTRSSTIAANKASTSSKKQPPTTSKFLNIAVTPEETERLKSAHQELCSPGLVATDALGCIQAFSENQQYDEVKYLLSSYLVKQDITDQIRLSLIRDNLSFYNIPVFSDKGQLLEDPSWSIYLLTQYSVYRPATPKALWFPAGLLKHASDTVDIDPDTARDIIDNFIQHFITYSLLKEPFKTISESLNKKNLPVFIKKQRSSHPNWTTQLVRSRYNEYITKLTLPSISPPPSFEQIIGLLLEKPINFRKIMSQLIYLYSNYKTDSNFIATLRNKEIPVIVSDKIFPDLQWDQYYLNASLKPMPVGKDIKLSFVGKLAKCDPRKSASLLKQYLDYHISTKPSTMAKNLLQAYVPIIYFEDRREQFPAWDTSAVRELRTLSEDKIQFVLAPAEIRQLFYADTELGARALIIFFKYHQSSSKAKLVKLLNTSFTPLYMGGHIIEKEKWTPKYVSQFRKGISDSANN